MKTMLRMVGFGDNAGSGFPMILSVWKDNGWIEPELAEDTRLNQVTLYLRMGKDQDENVIENVIDISEKRLKNLLPGYSKKKLAKAVTIIKMISDNPQMSIDDLRIALNVTDRTVARYISELKENKIIDRVGPDNGGLWKILL